MISWDNHKGLHLHNIFSSFEDAGEAQDDFWSISGDCIFRHHVEPRVKLYRPREETCPVPLKYIDVTSATHTTLDVIQESRIDDYWNIDVSKDLSDSWTGFTQFTLLKEKPPDGYMWSGSRLTKRQTTLRPDNFRPEKLGGKWKTKARKCPKTWRYLFQWTWGWGIQWDHQKFVPAAPVWHCKRMNGGTHGATRSKNDDHKSKLTTLQEEGVILYNITIWYTNSLRCLKRWKYLKQKQQWTKNGKNLRKFRHGLWRKSETNLTWSTNIDGSRDLSDPWTGFTQFTLLDEKPPDGYMWSGWRLTRKQLTSRPDHLWPELWKSMGKHAKVKEKQKWSNEKLHLENARKLRGIYFIDPEDKEFKETIKNSRKKLETSVAPAMPCKIMKNCGSGASNKIQTKLACILEADESTRLRMGNSVPNHHEDHIAGKGDNSLQHYNLVHKFVPMPQVMKIPAANAAEDKEWWKWRKFRRGTWPKSKVNQRWSMKQGRRAQKFISPHWWTSVIWKMPNWRQSTKKYKGRVVLRGDIVKDDSGSYAVFTEQGSSASQMTAARVMDIIQTARVRRTSSRRSICLNPG